MKPNTAPGIKMIMPIFPHDLVITERIAKIHHDIKSAQTISVNAPAGYGKTALILSFLNTLPAGEKILWYRLGPEDNDPELLIRWLVETLPCPEAVSGSGKKLIKEALAAAGFRELIEHTCLSLWNSDNRAGPDQIHLILDNCQHLDYSGKTATLLRQLTGSAPLLLKTYYLSRKPYSMVDEKYKLEKSHLQIDASDLLFSKEEVTTIIKALNYDFVDSNQIADINLVAEGWVAAALIMLQALKKQAKDSVNTCQRLEDDPGLMRYLAAEVFACLEKPDLEKYCQLSLLSEFNKENAALLFEIDDLEMELDKYPELTLFIFRTGSNPAEYRFHKLIRHYLEKNANTLFPGKQLAELHFRAAGYYIERGHFSRAAKHIRNCRDFEKTVELVTNVGIRFMLVGESGQLNNWLSMLPQELVSRNPVLLIFKALLLPQNEFGEAEKLLLKAFQYSREQKNPLILYRAATSLVFIYYCKNNMRGIAAITEKAGEELLSFNDDSTGRINLLSIMNSIGKSLFFQGLKQADNQDTSDLPEEDYWLYLAYSTVINLYLGKLDDAEKQITKALTLDCVEQTEPAKATALYLGSIVSVLKNNFEMNAAPLNALDQLSEKCGFSFFQAGLKYFSAYHDYLGQKYDSAHLKLDDAAFAYQAFGNQAMEILMKMLKQLWTRQVESSETAWEQITWEADTISRLKPGLLLEEITLSIRGAIAREIGHYNTAEQLLLQSIDKAKSKKAAQVLCGSYFHLAKLYYDTGKIEEGSTCLKQAMALASEGPFFMFWDIHLPTTVEMALRALQEDIAVKFAEELLSRLFNANASAFLRLKSAGLDDRALSTFVTAFLAEIKENPGKKFYHIKATLFNNAAVEINGSTIPESAWKTKKNRGLLEYLILCSGKPVAKEKIIDLFWPDSDHYSAQTSLRTALYQLRKIFSAQAVEMAGKESLIVETPETLAIENSKTLESDLKVYKEISRNLFAEDKTDKPANPAEQKSLEKLISLYRGDLLAGRDYGDVLLVEREKCKTIFEEACLRLSDIYSEQSKPGQAESVLERSLIVDPFSERTCLTLATTYMNQGKRTKALKLLNDHKKRLKKELGLDPDISIIEAIQNPWMLSNKLETRKVVN